MLGECRVNWSLGNRASSGFTDLLPGNTSPWIGWIETTVPGSTHPRSGQRDRGTEGQRDRQRGMEAETERQGQGGTGEGPGAPAQVLHGGWPALAGPSREPRGLPMGSGGASGHLGQASLLATWKECGRSAGGGQEEQARWESTLGRGTRSRRAHLHSEQQRGAAWRP